MDKKQQHVWSKPDAERVQSCQRHGCTVQQVNQRGPLRAFHWRDSPAAPWTLGMRPCAGQEAK